MALSQSLFPLPPPLRLFPLYVPLCLREIQSISVPSARGMWHQAEKKDMERWERKGVFLSTSLIDLLNTSNISLDNLKCLPQGLAKLITPFVKCQVSTKLTLKKKKNQINQSIKLAFLVILYLVADNRLERTLEQIEEKLEKLISYGYRGNSSLALWLMFLSNDTNN